MRGFVVIELIIVIAFVVILSALAWPFYKGIIARTPVESTARDVVEVLRRAQTKAHGSEMNSTWGVHFENDRFVLFKGASWVSRDSAFDELQMAPGNTTIGSSPTDIIFAKNGTTGSDSTVTISGLGTITKTISITSEGVIEIL